MSAWHGRFGGGWVPYRSAAQRRDEAARVVREAARRGATLAPIVIEGRKIASTFWGKAWCDNLERYRDFAHRLERGRSYVRSGAVVDLAITAGRVRAQVSGSTLYEVDVEIDEVAAKAWRAIQRDCAGRVASLVDLLAGRLSEAVMARLCAEETGLFPAPASIRFDCTCPDHATMCKHVAAVMYGVGARLDHAPELLFTLRKVTADDLLASVAQDLPAARPAPASARVLPVDDQLAALFGIDLVLDVAAAKRGRAALRKPAPKPRPARATTPVHDRKKARARSAAAAAPPPPRRSRAARGTR